MFVHCVFFISSALFRGHFCPPVASCGQVVDIVGEAVPHAHAVGEKDCQQAQVPGLKNGRDVERSEKVDAKHEEWEDDPGGLVGRIREKSPAGEPQGLYQGPDVHQLLDGIKVLVLQQDPATGRARGVILDPVTHHNLCKNDQGIFGNTSV